jgi:hypothetical protein
MVAESAEVVRALLATVIRDGEVSSRPRRLGWNRFHATSKAKGIGPVFDIHSPSFAVREDEAQVIRIKGGP